MHGLSELCENCTCAQWVVRYTQLPGPKQTSLAMGTRSTRAVTSVTLTDDSCNFNEGCATCPNRGSGA